MAILFLDSPKRIGGNVIDLDVALVECSICVTSIPLSETGCIGFEDARIAEDTLARRFVATESFNTSKLISLFARILKAIETCSMILTFLISSFDCMILGRTTIQSCNEPFTISSRPAS